MAPSIDSTNFALGMVQILGFSGNSTDRPHASTVEILSVVGPIADSGKLEPVKAQHVEPVRVRLLYQALSGRFLLPLWAMGPLKRPVIEQEFWRLLAELHHSRAVRIRVAGGGAGGDAPDAQASALGLPSGQPQPPKRPSVLPIMGYNESRWSSARSLVKSCVVVCRNDFLTSMYPKSLPDTLSRLI